MGARSSVSDFSITLKTPELSGPINIISNDFIKNPVYKVYGEVDEAGTIHWRYSFFDGERKREAKGGSIWDSDNYESSSTSFYSCGGFTFEIRAWDLDADSIEALSGRFSIGKSDIRSNIRQYRGLSVYRDKVLVLPKSDTTRDWLGMDARRISRVGKRISTSQIVGIINISNERNPQLKDTTDREKLADTPEYTQFVEILDKIISILQNEREKDKNDNKKRATLADLIAPLSSKPLLERTEMLAESGEGIDKIVEAVREYSEENAKQLDDLNERLIYYAQTASIGSIAMVIMHEILTGMTVIKRFINKSKEYFEYFDTRTKTYLNDAESGHKRLLDVADSFTPLYNRDLRKRENSCQVKSTIVKSIKLIKAKKISKDIDFQYDVEDKSIARMNEGELETILLNLFDNACYWIKDSGKLDKRVVIRTELNDSSDRIIISVSDSGSGILPEDAEKIFLPGITSKPRGIGMGLVIVNELVNAYGGKVGTRMPGDLKGATFVFDIPLKK